MVGFSAVLGGRQDLEVAFDVQAAHRLAAQGVDMIDFVRDAALSRPPGRSLVDSTDCVWVSPRHSCSEFCGVPCGPSCGLGSPVFLSPASGLCQDVFSVRVNPPSLCQFPLLSMRRVIRSPCSPASFWMSVPITLISRSEAISVGHMPASLTFTHGTR